MTVTHSTVTIALGHSHAAALVRTATLVRSLVERNEPAVQQHVLLLALLHDNTITKQHVQVCACSKMSLRTAGSQISGSGIRTATAKQPVQRSRVTPTQPASAAHARRTTKPAVQHAVHVGYASLPTLPTDLLHLLYSHLSLTELCAVTRLCRTIQTTSCSDALWRRLLTARTTLPPPLRDVKAHWLSSQRHRVHEKMAKTLRTSIVRNRYETSSVLEKCSVSFTVSMCKAKQNTAVSSRTISSTEKLIPLAGTLSTALTPHTYFLQFTPTDSCTLSCLNTLQLHCCSSTLMLFHTLLSPPLAHRKFTVLRSASGPQDVSLLTWTVPHVNQQSTAAEEYLPTSGATVQITAGVWGLPTSRLEQMVSNICITEIVFVLSYGMML